MVNRVKLNFLGAILKKNLNIKKMTFLKKRNAICKHLTIQNERSIMYNTILKVRIRIYSRRAITEYFFRKKKDVLQK